MLATTCTAMVQIPEIVSSRRAPLSGPTMIGDHADHEDHHPEGDHRKGGGPETPAHPSDATVEDAVAPRAVPGRGGRVDLRDPEPTTPAPGTRTARRRKRWQTTAEDTRRRPARRVPADQRSPKPRSPATNRRSDRTGGACDPTEPRRSPVGCSAVACRGTRPSVLPTPPSPRVAARPGCRTATAVAAELVTLRSSPPGYEPPARCPLHGPGGGGQGAGWSGRTAGPAP